ncbi:unnamed protein product [Alternaria burnsii]|nr:unnamed protein product [Alternaria burnsii]
MGIQISDEGIPSSSMSPTLYDLLGITEGIPLPSKQDISMLNPNAYPKVSTPAKSPDTVDEDKAIQLLLQGGLRPEQIINFVRIHKVSKEAGNHEALDIISGVQTDELLQRIHRVETLLVSAAPTSSNKSVFTARPTSIRLMREPSEGFDKKLDVSFQEAGRVSTAIMERHKPKNVPESVDKSGATDVPGPAKTHRRGCPGNCWNCKPRELKPRTYWTSFKKFREHYKTHLEDHRVEGHRWQCHLCDLDSFGGNGHDLMQHLWDAHFK